MEKSLLSKYEELKQYIETLKSAAVAFSGGVDSTFLLYAAREALGDKMIAVTVSSHFFPKRELDEAAMYCEQLNIRHYILETNELEVEGIAQNPENRCYLCKYDMFEKIKKIAHQNGIDEVAEGSNLDDNGDYRPGLAAIKELGIRSPLRCTGFTKQEIRDLSEYLNIPVWNKPSFACLASRFPYGEEITEKRLAMVDKAEQLLLDMGFGQLRVRIHGNVARIELLPEEFGRFMAEEVRKTVYDRFREYGFSYVALDIRGYRTGSMNETIVPDKEQARQD